jgi:hypothetical protein
VFSVLLVMCAAPQCRLRVLAVNTRGVPRYSVDEPDRNNVTRELCGGRDAA